MVDRHSWGLLHSKRLLLNFCCISTSEICWRKGYIVDYPVTCFMPMKEMNSSSLASTGWGFPNAIRRSMFSYILQCTENAFILPLICSQQCAMICFTSSESSQTPRWAQTREQQPIACFSLLPAAMIAAKAKEVWHEDKRAFPQSESFFWDSLIFEKGVAIFISQAEKKFYTKWYLLKIRVSQNLANLWGGEGGGGVHKTSG